MSLDKLLEDKEQEDLEKVKLIVEGDFQDPRVSTVLPINILPKEKPKRTPRTPKSPKPKTKIIVPDFNDFLKFCDKYRKDDFEIEQFYRHTMPTSLYRKVYPDEKVRSGGGWSGAVKATINIMRKMEERGELK